VDVAARVLVGSDHHPAREEIIREAWRRTGAAARAVYVGDGLWDLHAARALGIPFVGVDPERTGVLVAAGVRSVVAGYADPDAFLRTLREAAVP
jgi:phosphoglycolate phosphatase-like HAD superfamily hydrolase